MNDTGYKIILLGDSGVGKSTLVHWFIYNRQPLNISPTIGAAFAAKKIKIKNKIVKLYLWDTAGQERFRSITKMYYSGSLGCICVFDVTDYTSFKNLEFWVNDFQKNNNTNIKTIIVANKCDLDKSTWKVTDNEIKKFCDDKNCDYVYTSCVSGNNVQTIFDTMALEMASLKSHNNNLIQLDNDDHKELSRCYCM
ncbi:Rab family GTPase [Cotonvirus japonicus]|uniref:Rab family GTPase n=1 Tax=Cotonvirus japonicus TaxID=2811091 RepID=A0ABM7NS31_9VIRU|nr:Rab family GTPase [Cotonvirus japonicus]BCS82959.1 Rab family GTPase [Cotonvirus japonicus]